MTGFVTDTKTNADTAAAITVRIAVTVSSTRVLSDTDTMTASVYLGLIIASEL